MACSNCAKTSTTTNCTSGCRDTVNTDCVIYDDVPLAIEDSSVDEGDKRTLTSILQLIDNCGDTESKIINFNNDGETDDGTSYTVLAEDAGKILLFKQTDDDTDAAITYTIVLPETEDFINKEIIFKDISKPLDSGTTTLTYQFNLDIQYDWNPVTTSNDFYTLADVTHKVLILKFVKITPTSYAWIVVSAAGQELDVQALQDDVDDLMADPDLVEFEDVDLTNDWVTHALNVQAQRKGSLISLRGYVKSGDNTELVFTLPTGYRPPRLLEFTSHTSTGVVVSIVVATTGGVFVSVFGIASGDPVTDYVTLSNISFHNV